MVRSTGDISLAEWQASKDPIATRVALGSSRKPMGVHICLAMTFNSSMFVHPDSPFALREESERRRREKLLDDRHMAPLTKYVAEKDP